MSSVWKPQVMSGEFFFTDCLLLHLSFNLSGPITGVIYLSLRHTFFFNGSLFLFLSWFTSVCRLYRLVCVTKPIFSETQCDTTPHLTSTRDQSSVLSNNFYIWQMSASKAPCETFIMMNQKQEFPKVLRHFATHYWKWSRYLFWSWCSFRNTIPVSVATVWGWISHWQ